MKRLILLILIISFLLLPLAGCNNKNDPTGTTNSTTVDNTLNMPTSERELDKNSELVLTLVAYLEQYWVEYDLIGRSLENKINDIKNGIQPLHVVFDPDSYYFVCGYYNSPFENGDVGYEKAKEYTWVKYEDETEIQEYYNGIKWAVVFQINKALTITDILSNDTAVPNMEHFQIYKPTFENGANTAEPIVFDKTFIYLDNFLNQLDEDVIYHSKSWYYHSNVTISCVYIDGEYYLPFYLATLEDGEIFDAQQALSTNQFTYTLGEYYDAIIRVMDTEKYSVVVNEKYTYRYGVVSIDDFVNSIFR